jgi:Na+-driven multidrug efflux pump
MKWRSRDLLNMCVCVHDMGSPPMERDDDMNEIKNYINEYISVRNWNVTFYFISRTASNWKRERQRKKNNWNWSIILLLIKIIFSKIKMKLRFVEED